MATKKTKVVKDAIDPEVIVGSHLTVYKYANGKTELKWDDAALMRDVQEALDSVNKPDPKKVAKKVKKAVEEVVEKIAKPAKKKTATKTTTKEKTTATKAKKTK